MQTNQIEFFSSAEKTTCRILLEDRNQDTIDLFDDWYPSCYPHDSAIVIRIENRTAHRGDGLYESNDRLEWNNTRQDYFNSTESIPS